MPMGNLRLLMDIFSVGTSHPASVRLLQAGEYGYLNGTISALLVKIHRMRLLAGRC